MMPRIGSSIRETIESTIKAAIKLDRGNGHLTELERFRLVDDAAALIEQAVNQGETEEARLRRRDITTC